jgi:excisionase family DNA binding protein
MKNSLKLRAEKARVAKIEITPLLLSTGQAARRLGVGKTKMLEMIRGKRIACKMLDGRIRVPLSSVEDFASNLATGYVKGARWGAAMTGTASPEPSPDVSRSLKQPKTTARTRERQAEYTCRGVTRALHDTVANYRRPLWDDTDSVVVVTVEKDALAGVISPSTIEQTGTGNPTARHLRRALEDQAAGTAPLRGADRTTWSREARVVDPFAVELRAQREAAEAADEEFVRRRRAAAEQLSRNQLQARRGRRALERPLEKAATNPYQRRLVAIALRALPVDLLVRFNKRGLARQKLLGRAFAGRIELAHLPVTSLGLITWQHEIFHVLMHHEGRSAEAEVAAERGAQELLRAHGLRIPSSSARYLKGAIERARTATESTP